MTYPKTFHDINALALENEDILKETYGANASVFGQPSKVPLVVECFRVLSEHVEELDGVFLELLAGCAGMIFKEGFDGKRDLAEPVFFRAVARLT
jgi:hypothetical protein